MPCLLLLLLLLLLPWVPPLLLLLLLLLLCVRGCELQREVDGYCQQLPACAWLL
jgi:hypothetical protein